MRGFNSNILDLDTRARFTSKYGFSVVAPMRVTVPSSTNGSRKSCCALLNLWISSTNRMVLRSSMPRASFAF